MKKIITDQRIPIKIWSAEIEKEAEQQLINTANLPFVFKHVAVMPDVHAGKGATIGSVVATKGAIIPACVGVDIGCGMMAVKTDLNHLLVQENIKKIRHSIERSVPVGFEANRNIIASVENWQGFKNYEKIHANVNGKFDKVQKQLGTLGGGNHFIEVCLDENNAVWVMLHSGSRNIGKTIAEYHINEAKDLMKKFFINLPDPDLAYLALETTECKNYLDDLFWAQSYALQNRVEMMNRIMKDLSYAMGFSGEPLKRLMEVNCHHNYVDWENHFDNNVLVTRKGAVRARKEDYGIIPGSMGTKSYIVKGLGNEESFCSCSHGAGRKMSRTKARNTFTIEDLKAQTEGVDCRKDIGILDEIPGAYKSIDEVMENQKDLVEIVATLKQIMCIKG